MALAFLLNQIPQLDPSLQIKPVAFIVNHNARPGSRLEADSVARQLQEHSKPVKAKQAVFQLTQT